MLPGSSSAASFQAIQANIGEKQAAIENARAKEGVLTGDISALSKRIRTLTPRDRVAAPARGARAEHARRPARPARARAAPATRWSTSASCALRRKLRRAQGVLAARLVEIYKADQPDMLSVILESDGFNDLLVRADYMNAIGQQDSVIVDKVRELKRKSAQKRLLLVVLKSQAEEAVQVIEAKQRELQETRAAIQAREADLAAARKYKYGKLGNVQGAPPRAGGRPARAAGGVRAGDEPAPGRGPGAGRPDPPGRRRLHLAGERPGRVAVRHALGPPARGRRHRGAGRHADPGGGERHASRWRAGWAATASTRASSTAAASRRATRTSRRSA